FPAQPERNDFNAGKLGPEWLYIRNPDYTNYSLSERKGHLRLKGSAFTLNDKANPTFAGIRQTGFKFQATTRLDFNPAEENEEAGMTLLMNMNYFYKCFVVKRGEERFLQVVSNLDQVRGIQAEILLEKGPVDIRIEGERNYYHFYFSQQGRPFVKLARLNTKPIGVELTGGFTGVLIGLYATGNGHTSTTPADFGWIDYKVIEK
ncbi:MAG: glycoside hydrolase family 43 protein, partial [Bacteroides sp.]|nr:glycoside hydrolase family 43 protein [Bacteroides sp.]